MSVEKSDSFSPRRTVIQAGIAAGVAGALSSLAPPSHAAESSAPILRTIPSTGEKLPVVGIGTNAFSVNAPRNSRR